jgi:hypothetical protein
MVKFDTHIVEITLIYVWPLEFLDQEGGLFQKFYSWPASKAYRINCEKTEVSSSSQFVKRMAYIQPASQTESISAFSTYKNALKKPLRKLKINFCFNLGKQFKNFR